MVRATLAEREIRRVVGLGEAGERIVKGILPLDDLEDECLSFTVRELDGPDREAIARRRGCVLLAPIGSALAVGLGDCVVLEVKDPRRQIAAVLAFVHSEGRQEPLVAEHRIAASAVISPLAVIEPPVEIEDDVVIEPFCLVGPDVRIGRGTILRSGVRLFSRVVIGQDCRLGSNAVIGQDGYGYVRDEHGNKVLIAHLGGVVLGSNVEIGALSGIQSGTLVPTVIEDYTKVGSHVGISHNARVGKNVGMPGGVVVGGRAVIDDEAWIGMNATIRDGRRVGAHAVVGMDASVQRDIPDHAITRAARPAVAARSDEDQAPPEMPEP